MAACSFGSSSLKLSNLNLKLGLVRPRTGVVQSLNELKIRTPVRVQHSGLLISRRSEKPALIHVGCSSVHAEPSTIKEGDSQEAVPSSATSQCIPSPYEVESLITDICDTTSIAEFDLKLGGFRLYVKRDLIKKSEISLPAPVSANSSGNLPDQNGSVSSPSSAISKPLAASSGIQYYLDRAADEGFVIIQSPRVGFFRRSQTIKGKRAPPPCNEKQKVKEGQVLCYIEQLGGELPIESDVSGEVIKILREDGDPVGYGDALIAILPS